MELDNIILMDCEERMDKSIASFSDALNKVKTGRASASLVRDVEIDYWGSMTPLYQVANISTPDATQIVVKPYDKNQLKEIERAINEANLGITPVNNGEMIILTVPELTEEKRRDYVKQAKGICEDARVALRNIRQDANNEIKKSEYPEDEEKIYLEEVQELVNEYNKKIDAIFKEKEAELMRV